MSMSWWKRIWGGTAEQVETSDAVWTKAQAGEFEFHRTNQWRQTDDFMANTVKFFKLFGLEPDGYAGRTVMDVGAGSRLRTLYFQQATLVALEPLADRFRREIPWCDLDRAHAVISTPAEQLAEAWVGKVDLVISINVLDHCYSFQQILANIFAYLKPGGLALLSFDSHETTDHMHPLVLTEPVCREHFRRAGFRVDRVLTGLEPYGRSYGHGDTLTFWAFKP